MAYAKSTKSVRSILSHRSTKSAMLEKVFREERKGDGDLHSFDHMLTMACTRFQCPYTVSVLNQFKPDYLKNLKQSSTKQRQKRISVLPETHILDESDSKPDTKPELKLDVKTDRKSSRTSSLSYLEIVHEPASVIDVTLIYDHYNTLTEILIMKMYDVPRSLLKIISLLVPYYQHLVRITVSNCAIDMYTIYTLSKILGTSTITEICLDGSALAEADYTMLLETAKLKYLSLCRCKIQDEACKSIAASMCHANSAQYLLLLNLSSNHITDEGAKHISNALRTNRHLRYLNLADNHISDCGVGQILDVLIEFPLTSEEIANMHRRRLKYLQRRNDLYAKFLAEQYFRPIHDDNQLRKKSPRTPKSKTITKKVLTCDYVDDDYKKTKAEMLTAETLGSFEDPFYSETIKRVEGHVYSIGNMCLAHLNLAYNNLSYLSIRKLQNVLKYQTNYKSGGLVRVVLEGNDLPVSCPELAAVDELLASYNIKQNVLSKSSRELNKSLQYEGDK